MCARCVLSQEGLLPVGTEIRATHFVPGQYVDVTGTTIGKGFQVGVDRDCLQV